KSYFTYSVKHTDAGELAKTLEQLIGSRAATTTPAAAGAAPAATTPARSSRVVVDKPTNTLIVDAAAEDYTRIASRRQTLDRPAKGALIEVTVAELSTTDTGQLGIEWLLNHVRGDGNTITGGTLGGLTLGTGGATFKVLNSAGDVRVVLNALA